MPRCRNVYCVGACPPLSRSVKLNKFAYSFKSKIGNEVASHKKMENRLKNVENHVRKRKQNYNQLHLYLDLFRSNEIVK